MASQSETGHAKNVANFANLIDICETLGPAYQPVPALQIPALQAALSRAKAQMTTTDTAQAVYSRAVAEKEAAFKPLSPLITRVINNFGSCGASNNEVSNAATISKKITGAARPAKKKGVDGKEDSSISQSQLSEDMRIKNLNSLIEILDASPEYQPNEGALTTAALKTLSDTLLAQVKKVDAANIPLTKSREERDITLYKEKTGLVDLAKAVKKYTLSLLGSSSAVYKKINALSFRTF